MFTYTIYVYYSAYTKDLFYIYFKKINILVDEYSSYKYILFVYYFV